MREHHKLWWTMLIPLLVSVIYILEITVIMSACNLRVQRFNVHSSIIHIIYMFQEFQENNCLWTALPNVRNYWHFASVGMPQWAWNVAPCSKCARNSPSPDRILSMIVYLNTVLLTVHASYYYSNTFYSYHSHTKQFNFVIIFTTYISIWWEIH